MKPREINPKPCDPTLDTHRGGDEGQARRLLTESRVKQEEQAKLRKTDSPWGGCVVLCPRGSLQMAESSQGELDRWAGVGARFPNIQRYTHKSKIKRIASKHTAIGALVL